MEQNPHKEILRALSAAAVNEANFQWPLLLGDCGLFCGCITPNYWSYPERSGSSASIMDGIRASQPCVTFNWIQWQWTHHARGIHWERERERESARRSGRLSRSTKRSYKFALSRPTNQSTVVRKIAISSSQLILAAILGFFKQTQLRSCHLGLCWR